LIYFKLITPSAIDLTSYLTWSS